MEKMMTPKQFDEIGGCAGMKAKYDGRLWIVASSDFTERLYGLMPADTDDFDGDDIKWVRCESVDSLLVPNWIQSEVEAGNDIRN